MFQEFAETAMNELLGWYGYNTTKQELKVLKRRCHSYSGSNSSEPDSPKYTGRYIDNINCLIHKKSSCSSCNTL